MTGNAKGTGKHPVTSTNTSAFPHREHEGNGIPVPPPLGGTESGTRHSLRWERRPWTLNAERRGGTGPYKRAALVREWRATFNALALEAELPPHQAIDVEVTVELRNRSGEPDTAACIGAAKAAIDGLVDAGVIPHDGPAVVRTLTFHAPVVTGVDALTLTIREAAA